MNKQKFLRKDYKEYKPKYKAYCKLIVVDKLELKRYELFKF